MPLTPELPITYVCADGSAGALETKTYPAGEPLITSQDSPIRLLVRPRVLSDLHAALYWADALAERGRALPELILPCVPGARQDRLNPSGDQLFTIKSIARDLNARRFPSVTILDPHSDVTPALIERCRVVKLHFEGFDSVRKRALAGAV